MGTFYKIEHSVSQKPRKKGVRQSAVAGEVACCGNFRLQQLVRGSRKLGVAIAFHKADNPIRG
ncbi:hypothetical protein [Nostoc sp. 'Peltigera membranacea cyanobiont' 210A]|uniref:hypothetical protein n=1 Tax=Nostoc sp. 'Peltigera membranacea cyanobiont' 210A TaxID=2014529 RepID=UPI00117C1112|nr:hypothetical protein [Nostoc sp. 'Peltigera membranacea cyanobiont' 210A]